MFIKVVIFDIDDTLVRTIGCKWLALKETAKKYYHLKIEDEHIKKYWGLPFEKMLSGVFSNIDDIYKIKEKYINMSKKFPMKAQEYTVETVKYLHEKYLLTAITSSSRSVILDDLISSGLDLKDFYNIQTAEDTPVHKPDPAVFNPTFESLKKMKMNKNNMVYVGDAIKDYQAAKKAGINFIGITTGLTAKEDFIQIGLNSKLIFRDLRGLKKAI